MGSDQSERQPISSQATNSFIVNSYKLEANSSGLSTIKCAVFIVAQMAGSGILALPDAMSGTGWTGLLLLFAFGALACYCGVMLGKCWIIVRKTHEVPGHIRDPYPLIGYYAAGKTGKYIVEFCVMTTMVGVSVIYLLLSSREVSSISNISLGSVQTDIRLWVLIIGFILIACTWFASPKEMWLFAYGASLSSVIASILIVIRASVYITHNGVAPEISRAPPTVDSFFSAFGTIAFSFGGGAIFPTFQSDMKKPSNFIYAAMLGFAGVVTLYLPVAILPYVGLGNNIDPNILQTLKRVDSGGKDMITAAECLITFHLLFVIIIVNNPISQQIEEHLGIEHKFGWRRIAVRSSVMILVIGLAEMFPNFGPILSLIGASTVTMMSFILPIVFYFKLQNSNLIQLHQRVFHYEIVFVAVIFGCCGVYSAIKGMRNPFIS